METETSYILTISKDTNSDVSVTRTYSAAATSGFVHNGDTVYSGDKLKITFTSKQNHSVDVHKVNGETFVSGNTYSVSGDVNIQVTSYPLVSTISAKDAYIGSGSRIIIEKKAPVAYHSIRYTFGDLTGYVSSSGLPVETEDIYADVNIDFIIPSEFYRALGDSTSLKCTLYCQTYADSLGDTMIGGTTSCEFLVQSSSDINAPSVSGTVKDINPATTSLTGDSSIIVRYLSDVECTISAEAKNGASIISTKINTAVPTGNSHTFENVSNPTFSFYASDSRGYSSTEVVTVQMINYIRLTAHPTVSRLSSDNTKVQLSISGKFYNGSFGSFDNKLHIKYRYREASDPEYSDWTPVDTSLLAMSSSSYETESPILIDGIFASDRGYSFEVIVSDGTPDVQLSSITKTTSIVGGLPVFCWNDEVFNINVDNINHKGLSIYDIIYPIGSVYMSAPDSLPEVIGSIGEWVTKDIDVQGVSAWERVS